MWREDLFLPDFLTSEVIFLEGLLISSPPVYDF